MPARRREPQSLTSCTMLICLLVLPAAPSCTARTGDVFFFWEYVIMMCHVSVVSLIHNDLCIGLHRHPKRIEFSLEYSGVNSDI